MYDVLLTVLGVVLGVGILAIVYYVSQTPRRLDRKRWSPSASGERDGPTKHWPGGDPGSLP